MTWAYVGAAAVSVIGGAANQRDQDRINRQNQRRGEGTAAPYYQDIYQQAGALQAPDISGSLATQGLAGQGFLDYAQQLQGQIAPAQQASANILQFGTDPSNNPAFQQYLQLANEQLTQRYQQQVAPALRNQAVAAGNVGSSRAGVAEGIAQQGLTSAQGRLTADLTNRAYGQGLQAQLQALSLAPQTAGLGQMAPLAMLQAAATQQAGETGQYQQDLSNLQAYQQLISGGGGQPQAPLPQSNQLATTAGLFSTLAGGIQAYQGSGDGNPQGDYQPRLDTGAGTYYD